MQRLISFLFLLLIASLAACSGQTDSPPATATTDPAAAATQPPTATVPPPTPTALPQLVVLLAPPDAPAEIAEIMEAWISALAAERGLRWQLRQTITPEEVRDEVAFLVALPPQPELNGLVSAAPETHFLAVDVPGAVPAPNLILVGALSGSAEAEAFIAGYIGALLTPEARIGIITTEDDATALRFTAFENGMRFFCGLCRPQYAPFYEYPLLLSLPATAGDAEWRALADFMRDRFTAVVYVTPGAGGEVLSQALADHGIRIIGSTPPPAGLEPAWIGSLRSEPIAAYEEYLPRLLDGETDVSLTLPLLLLDVNPALLPEGKLRLIEQTLADVLAGYILPGAPVQP